MHNRDAIERDFRLLDAGWPRARALAIAQQSTARWFVVRDDNRDGTAPLYFVFPDTEAREKLAKSSSRKAGMALQVFASVPMEVVAADALLAPGPAWQIVLAGHVPVGIIEPAEAHRGATAMIPGAPVVIGAVPSASGGPAVRRDLGAQWPGSVDAGADMALLVSLAMPGAFGAGAVVLEATVGTRIDIVVRPLQGVTLDGTNMGTLQVGDPQSDQPLIFRFKAGAAGQGSVRVYAWVGGYSVASLDLHTRIREAGAAAGEAPPASVSVSVPAEPRAQPDLSLLITESGNEISVRLQSATSGFEGKAYEPVRLAGSTRDYFADFCRKIENLPVESDGQRTASGRKLALWGADMIDKVLPADLRNTLWQLRDRIGSVQITSDEAWIPWEVCRLMGTEADGSRVEGPFLAEAFCVTRWLHGVAPPARFSFGEWALVVPKDSGLPNAAQEAQFIHSKAGPGRIVTPVAANFCDLTAAMESKRFHAWHFCGHAHAGEAADGDQAAIELDDNDAMSADMFSGTVENALRTGPFVFLNACQSARGGLTLTGVGGWAQRFIRPSASRFAASAFLGSYWAVYDAAAFAFTVALYNGLIDGGKPVGQAVRDARLAVRTPDDPLTWLAYTVYADPLATIESR